MADADVVVETPTKPMAEPVPEPAATEQAMETNGLEEAGLDVVIEEKGEETLEEAIGEKVVEVLEKAAEGVQEPAVEGVQEPAVERVEEKAEEGIAERVKDVIEEEAMEGTADQLELMRKIGWDQVIIPAVKDPPQTGIAIKPACLPTLSAAQLQALTLAKKYCQDITNKHQQSKHTEQQVVQMHALQDAANKQRALLLMSRIYVGSINFELGEETVQQAFTPFGSIKAVNMSWDSATMKHKGYAFVEYETAEAAQLALEQMNGVIMGGRNIKVGRPNNVPQAAPVIAQIQEEAGKHARIYIASIHPDLCSTDVRSVFEAFGHIKNIDLAPDNSPGKHRGWGYIDYHEQKSATDAIASMNLFDLGGQFLRVGRALTPPMQLYPPNAGPVLPGLVGTNILGPAAGNVAAVAAVASAAALQAATVTPMGPLLQTPGTIEVTIAPPILAKAAMATPTAAAGVMNLGEIQAKLQAANEEREGAGQDVSTLQQEENMAISGSNARLMIMKKLSRKQESHVVVLRNMVSVEDLDEELEEEVTSECSRFGEVQRVVIYQERQGVEDDAEVIIKIFVIFSQPSGAEKAVQSLDGRWFGGRMITAQVYDQEKFEANELSH